MTIWCQYCFKFRRGEFASVPSRPTSPNWLERWYKKNNSNALLLFKKCVNWLEELWKSRTHFRLQPCKVINYTVVIILCSVPLRNMQLHWQPLLGEIFLLCILRLHLWKKLQVNLTQPEIPPAATHTLARHFWKWGFMLVCSLKPHPPWRSPPPPHLCPKSPSTPQSSPLRRQWPLCHLVQVIVFRAILKLPNCVWPMANAIATF